MSIDALLPRIEAARDRGAIVLVKWDGERTSRRCAIVISHSSSDFVWRLDTDQPEQALAAALAEFEATARNRLSEE